MTPEEMQKIAKEAFHKFDANKDTYLDRGEFRNCLSSLLSNLGYAQPLIPDQALNNAVKYLSNDDKIEETRFVQWAIREMQELERKGFLK